VKPPGIISTLGVVVVHKAYGSIAELPAVCYLAPQVDELLIVHNGYPEEGASANVHVQGSRVRSVFFASNRGTAAAWNAALRSAGNRTYTYLFILDQDSEPASDAVSKALAEMAPEGVAAVVQPVKVHRFGLDPFPWNTIASGVSYDVRAVELVGGFDERLFVDEVDHELLARLMAAGYKVTALSAATIQHEVGTPREIRFLGRKAVTSGHTTERRRLQGYSAGLLVRRYLRRTPALSARLVLRHTLTAAKAGTARERGAARAILHSLIRGALTTDSPVRAAERSCPFCGGALLGWRSAVADWRFGTGRAADVYRCSDCGALAAGRLPAADEIASWYTDYYTHTVEHPRLRVWSRLWPTPRRRREMDQLRRYFTPADSSGRFLDVGTGAGERLVQFSEAGWDVVGQDLDEKAGRLARERGLRLYHCPVHELLGREESFDLIGLTHVLEHALDPKLLLDACLTMLAPGGQLCIISPNAHAFGRWIFGRWWFGLEQPRHVGIPTVESLERLTARLGLEGVTRCEATNAAVILGGSLARKFQARLPAGSLQKVARFLTALVGQAIGRTALLVNRRLGEEVVWVGHRADS